MKPLRLLQLSDLHLTAEPNQAVHGLFPDLHLQALLPLVIDWRPELVVITGDLADEGDASAYHRLGDQLSVLDCPRYALAGNHDDPELLKSLLIQYDIHTPKHIDCDPWRLALLDSVVPGQPGGRLADSEMENLQQVLEGESDRHHLVFLHHHPVAVQSPWIDCQNLSNGDALVKLAQQHPGVKAVCWGHIHHLWDETQGDLRLLGTPAAAGQAKPRQDSWVDDDYGPRCRWFELHPDGTLETGILEARNPQL